MGRTASTEPQSLHKGDLYLYTSSKGFSFKPSHYFTAVEQLDRFDVDVVEKNVFMILSKVSNFIRNQLYLKVPMVVGVSVIPRSAGQQVLIYQGQQVSKFWYTKVSRSTGSDIPRSAGQQVLIYQGQQASRFLYAKVSRSACSDIPRSAGSDIPKSAGQKVLIYQSQQVSGRRPLTCWDRGFESHRGHGYLSVVTVVCCQVEVSATSLSLVQRSSTDCGASLCVI